MRQLIPRPGRDSEPDLAAVYAYPGHAPRWLRANMVTSADGAAQAQGVSGGLSGEADKKIFRTLRALADVILVGASTVRTEGYGRAVVPRDEFAAARAAAGQTPVAAIAVVSAGLELDFGSALYTEASVPTITVTTAEAPPDRLAAARAAGEVVIAGQHGKVDLAAAVDQLAQSGRGRILCEGGPSLLAAIAHARRLDELCLSIAPQLRAGDALRVMHGPDFDPALPLALHTLLSDDGYLFARYLVAKSSIPGRRLTMAVSNRHVARGRVTGTTHWTLCLPPTRLVRVRFLGLPITDCLLGPARPAQTRESDVPS